MSWTMASTLQVWQHCLGTQVWLNVDCLSVQICFCWLVVLYVNKFGQPCFKSCGTNFKAIFHIIRQSSRMWSTFKGASPVSGISGSLIWSKTPMELIFNLSGEVLLSEEGPVSQIHSAHLHIGAPGIFSYLLRSVQMLKREWDVESNGKLPWVACQLN